MRLAAWIVLGVVLEVSSAGVLAAQTAGTSAAAPVETQAVVSFQFERAGVTVPRFALRVGEDGKGSYQADVTEGTSAGAAMDAKVEKHVDRPVTLTPATVAKIFKAARGLNRFKMDCASKSKNIADTGTKTLSYEGPDGRGSCVYNYSDNKNVALLSDIFLGIAFTLDEGRRLEFLHRYDRLGLDTETTVLANEVAAGRALELGTIAPTLTAIVGDMALMQRVRLRAEKMLEHAGDK